MSKLTAAVLLLAGFILVACQNPLDDIRTGGRSDPISGRILVWHTWQGRDRDVFRELSDSFVELYPDVEIVDEVWSLDELEAVFTDQARAGFGPDILVAPADWAKRLAQAGMLRNISGYDIDTDIYLTSAVDMVQSGDNLFGLPLSLNTYVLYYNQALLDQARDAEEANDLLAQLRQMQETQQLLAQTGITETAPASQDPLQTLLGQLEAAAAPEPVRPPADLEAFLGQAEVGHRVVMPDDFYGAFWGIQTFGGQLFDEENRVVLNQGGFANWLAWLKRAQDNPYIIMDRRADTIYDLFVSGKATYYIGNSKELPALQDALGADVLGVSRLPGRQNRPAGPLLEVEAAMFSQASDSGSARVAVQFAQYLSNAEQQQEWALKAGKLPANKQVRIDARVAPIVAELVAQSRTAVPVSLGNIDKLNDLSAAGDDLYAQVLDGEVGVGEAANQLTEQINQSYGIETLAASYQEVCELAGTSLVWHSWTGSALQALVDVRDAFMRICPNTFIMLKYVDAAELPGKYVEIFDSSRAPDLIIGDNILMTELASEELVQNIGSSLDSEFTQRFFPLVEQSSLFEGNPYGIPVSAETSALYYNTDLVDDPPVVLSELLTIAGPDSQVAMPIGFSESYWGVSAFGESSNSHLFGDDRRLIIGSQGLPEWLAWLKEASNVQGIVMSEDAQSLSDLFIAGDAAYLIGDSTQLGALQAALGSEKVGVVSLPSGSPLMTTELLMFSPFCCDAELEIAYAFAKYATGIESQNLLMDMAAKIPVNINVDTSEHPAVGGFVQQLETAVAVPNITEARAVFDWGDQLYRQVLENEIDPFNAVSEFTTVVDITNGFEVVETEIAEAACTEAGEISLWHSWTEPEALGWQDVIAGFAEACPNIVVNTTYIPPLDFTRSLTETQEAESELPPPDLFFGSHTQLEDYRVAGLIQDISPPAIDSSLLIDYVPISVSAMSSGDELYGLPQTLHLQALFYNTELVEEPAATLEALNRQAEDGAVVGFPASFTDLLWGASALGCAPCATGVFFDELGEPLIEPDDLANWKAWLEAGKEAGRIVFSRDQAELESRFIAGELAYLVADPLALNNLHEQMGIANVGVTLLPAGSGELLSTPYLQVDGLMVFKDITEEQTALALKFAEFATSRANQTLLMQTANLIPTNNLSLIAVDDDALFPFIDQIDAGVLVPDSEQMRTLQAREIVYSLFDPLLAE